MANDSLHSRTSTPSSLGLTKKQYYSRLNQLLDAGLIARNAKESNTYSHTTLGRIVFHRHLVPLMQQIRNAKTMIMIDTLKNARKFTDADIDAFISPLLERMNLSIPSTMAADATKSSDNSDKIKMVLSESEIEPSIARYLKQSAIEVFVATRTFYKPMMKLIFEKGASGVSVKLLADTDIDSYLDNKFEHLLFEELKESFGKALGSLRLNEDISIRRAKVPFEIILVDDRVLIIGLIDRQNVEKFNALLIIEDPKMACDIHEQFLSLWKSANAITPKFNSNHIAAM